MLKKYNSREYSAYKEDNLVQISDRIEKAQTNFYGNTSHQMLLNLYDENRRLKDRQAQKDESGSEIFGRSRRDPQRDLEKEFLRTTTSSIDEARELAHAVLQDEHFKGIGMSHNQEDYHKEIQEAAITMNKRHRNMLNNRATELGGNNLNKLLPNSAGRVPLIEDLAKQTGTSYEQAAKAADKAAHQIAMNGGSAKGMNHSVFNRALAMLTNDQPMGGKMPVKVQVKAGMRRTPDGKPFMVKAHMRTYWVNMSSQIPEEIQQKVATKFGIDPMEMERYVSSVLRQPNKMNDANFMMQAGMLMQQRGIGLISNKYKKQSQDHDLTLSDAQHETLAESLAHVLKTAPFLAKQRESINYKMHNAKYQAKKTVVDATRKMGNMVNNQFTRKPVQKPVQEPVMA